LADENNIFLKVSHQINYEVYVSGYIINSKFMMFLILSQRQFESQVKDTE